MRLDKFLKVTRIIKRRTVAKELADNGNITVNGEQKKSSYEVKKNLDLPPESLKKELIDNYIQII